jgi:SAM-dependent methyltransferase
MQAGGYGSHAIAARLGRKYPILAGALRALYPPMPTLNIIPAKTLRAIQTDLFPEGGLVLNIGAGGADGCGARLWRGIEEFGARIIALDIGVGPNIALAGDAALLPFIDAIFDSVVLQAVLEHVPEPERVIAESLRVLKPGGHIYVEMPFLQGFHADPHDYQRYTLEGLRLRLAGAPEINAGVSVGPFSTLVWMLRDGLSSWTRQPILYAACRFLAGWIFAPLRYFDLWVGDSRVGRRLANEFYYLGRKPPGDTGGDR